MTNGSWRLIAFVALIPFGSPAARAQLIHAATPQQAIGESYNERLGIAWALRGPGWFANVPNGVGVPAFGGGNPNAGLSGGFAGRSGNVSGSLGFQWSQGSNRSMSTTSPSLTTLNGYPGSIFSGSQRPFVTSLTPSVGSFTPPNEGIRQAGRQRQQATLESIAQRKGEVRNEKADLYWERAQRAEVQGNLKMARANYRLALPHANEPLRSQIVQRMATHGWAR
ncbi:hypothetical protein Poly24_21810 [Rosistilla carotiformis]|uniref:Tetratricopeptide repeat protein n=1 Tax=Rosistilla carotiformis TaxID=2528017 RepID=A0A518JSF2_9BACT|nr:hypothetical protein [Rosistilla carotiformis]QDV68472.1 hypothetical protein Poly24_21810 [Rosistilla carotiformis]